MIIIFVYAVANNHQSMNFREHINKTAVLQHLTVINDWFYWALCCYEWKDQCIIFYFLLLKINHP